MRTFDSILTLGETPDAVESPHNSRPLNKGGTFSKPRLLKVDSDIATFEPQPGQLHGNNSRRKGKGRYWTCVKASPNLSFLMGMNAHAAHLLLVLRGAKWEWL